jgi:hypothetical protein
LSGSSGSTTAAHFSRKPTAIPLSNRR